MLNGNIVPEEWEYMQRRAELVQVLDLRTWVDRKRLAPSAWIYLTHLTHTRPLLPNLRSLSFCFKSPLSTAAVRPLLSPTIVELGIYCNVRSDRDEWICSLRSLFHMVSSIATHLTWVELRTDRPDEPLPLTIFSPLEKLTRLRSIHWRFNVIMDLSVLRSLLLNLKGLETLELETTVEAPVHHRGQSHPLWSDQGQDGLRVLKLRYASLTIADDIKLFHFFASQNLQELHMCGRRDGSLRYITILSAEIARCFPRLQVLDWWFLSQTTELVPQGSSSLVMQVIQPLMKLRLLTSLVMFGDSILDGVTEADIGSITKAWPRLSTLHINSSVYIGRDITP